MANENSLANLITPEELNARLTPEQRRENARKAGQASVLSKARSRTTAEIVSKILSSKQGYGKSNEKLLNEFGYEVNERNVHAAIVAQQAKQAIHGSRSAADFVIAHAADDDVGEGIAKYVELPARLMGRDFVDLYRDISERRHREYHMKGGRLSLKSSHAGLFVVDLIEKNERFCGLAMRQIKDTMKDSVYSQITWAIDELGLTEQYKCTKNPLEITKKSTGQKIYFRGADDPMKVKSLKPPKDMHIGVLWLEEADQLKGMEAIRNIRQSVMRGGDDYVEIWSYNTPKSQQHFVNVDEREPKAGKLIHFSNYQNAPKEWLGTPALEEAEHLRETNEKAWRHEYMGEAIGTGGSVFENVTIRPISDKEIEGWDRIYHGLDFGWYPDPLHFSEMYYNAAQRRLFIFGEWRANKTSNEEAAKKLAEYKDKRITADSAEPKSINDFHSWGFDIRGAIKGPGSVEYSMKWLASLAEITIDDRRCPHSAHEFLTYEYEQDKDGLLISGYPDKDNHAIDSVRYALSEVWRRRGK